METVIAIAAVGLLTVLAPWGFVRSRRRGRAVRQAREDVARVLERVEASAERLERALGDGASAAPVRRTVGNAPDAASWIAGIIYRDVGRAIERDETWSLAGSYSPPGALIAERWSEPAHSDSDALSDWIEPRKRARRTLRFRGGTPTGLSGEMEEAGRDTA